MLMSGKKIKKYRIEKIRFVCYSEINFGTIDVPF
jgi:hypothetical protein